MARILAFDTATPVLSVALYDDQRLIAATQIQGQRQHGAILLPTIVNLLEQVGWQQDMIDCLAVGKGPGSYTGLRMAVTLAKTWADSKSIPLVTASSLALLASGIDPRFLNAKTLLVPIMDARRMTCYSGLYTYEAQRLIYLKADCHVDWLEWQAQIVSQLNEGAYQEAVVIGQALTAFEASLDASLIGRVRFIECPLTVAHLPRLVCESVTQPELFVPQYCHMTLAEQEWQNQQTNGSEAPHEGYIDIFA